MAMAMAEPKSFLGFLLIIPSFVTLTNLAVCQLHSLHKAVRSRQRRGRKFGLVLLITVHQGDFVEGFPAVSPVGLIASTENTASNRSSGKSSQFLSETTHSIILLP